jgi:tyrosine-protein kinase Etk/Wzc
MFINTQPVEDRKPINFKGILTRYAYNWPLFIAGLVLTFSAAYLYLQIANPVYEVKASLMVKDDEKNPDEKSVLYELDLTDSHKAAENEIEVLQSRTLVNKVIKDLQLWTTYTSKNGLSKQDLYTSSPVKFVMLNADSTTSIDKVNLTIKIKDKNSFELKTADGNFKTFAFNSTLKNNFGLWKLVPTSTIENYKGDQVNIALTDLRKTADNYQKAIVIELLDKKTPVIGLSIKDQVPERGEDVLNDLIKVYNNAAIAEKNRLTQSTLDFIDQRLASLTGEVSSAEKSVEAFRSTRGLTDISSQSQIYLQNFQSNDDQLNQINVKLKIVDDIEKYVNSPNGQGNVPATFGIDDPLLRKLLEKLADEQTQHSSLAATVPENNPAFIALNRQIAATRAAIKENVGNIKSSLLTTRQQLETYNAKFESTIKNLPHQEREYIDIKRQESIKENLYNYLLQKKEELSLSYAATKADARIVDNAYAGAPLWPKKSIVFAVAFLLGLTLPAGFIYSRRLVGDKITTLTEIETRVAAPVIAELSYVKTRDALVLDNKKNFMIAEQFRMLRTNLATQSDKKSGRIILITSSIANEGKSFTTSNLAMALALSGRKAILLEMDLRRPKISRSFGLKERSTGMSDFLTNSAQLPEIIQSSGYENLDIIGSGGLKEISPAELFERKSLADIIQNLQGQYDDIIIDSSPVHLVTDAMILAKYADITLYVIRQGVTGKAELAFINNLDQRKKLNNMNIIFNGIQRARYGYGYKYDNSYYKQS